MENAASNTTKGRVVGDDAAINGSAGDRHAATVAVNDRVVVNSTVQQKLAGSHNQAGTAVFRLSRVSKDQIARERAIRDRAQSAIESAAITANGGIADDVTIENLQLIPCIDAATAATAILFEKTQSRAIPRA